MRAVFILAAAMLASACSADGTNSFDGTEVVTSGKTEVAIAEVPSDVLAAASQRVADLKLTEAETELRNGVRYYDLGGSLPDGSEMELDIMQDGASWRVVETQRDLDFTAVPRPVADAALASDPGLKPTRVIESRQEDGLVIYELFSPAGSDPVGAKKEVRWDGKRAEVLTSEWVH